MPSSEGAQMGGKTGTNRRLRSQSCVRSTVSTEYMRSASQVSSRPRETSLLFTGASPAHREGSSAGLRPRRHDCVGHGSGEKSREIMTSLLLAFSTRGAAVIHIISKRDLYETQREGPAGWRTHA